MQNIKYHLINTAAILLFSYTTASAINEVVKFSLAPTTETQKKKKQRAPRRTIPQGHVWTEYEKGIVEKNFFEIASIQGPGSEEEPPIEVGNVSELTLLGTITGPWNIRRAMIQKQGEKEPGIFALYKASAEITNDVYGYKLTRVYDTKVYITAGEQKYELNLYEKKTVSKDTGKTSTSGSGSTVKKTISRSEVQQIASGKIDNATRGLRAGPYRVNGKIVGYQLIRVRPYNILYKLGARSGDIIKRVNGKSLDSTEKLLQMWGALKSESKVTVDLERGGRPMTFDFSVSD